MGKLFAIKQGDGKSLDELDLSPGKVIALFDTNLKWPQPLAIAVVGENGIYNEIDPKDRKDLILLRDPPGSAILLERRILSTKTGLFCVHELSIKCYTLEDLRNMNYTVNYAWVGKDNILRAIKENPLRDRMLFNQQSEIIEYFKTIEGG